MRLVEDWAWSYDDALAWMEDAWAGVVDGGPMQVAVGSHREEVITLGRHAPEEQIRDRARLEARGARVVRVARGGGATAHGPGQLVLYPVVNLRTLGCSVPRFCWLLEESVLRLLDEEGLVGHRLEGLPGVYVEERKVASLGFRSRRGVVTHGLAVNASNDLGLFQTIAACGEDTREVTSLDRERAGSTSTRSEESKVEDVSERVCRRGRRLAAHFLELTMLTCDP